MLPFSLRNRRNRQKNRRKNKRFKGKPIRARALQKVRKISIM